MSVGKFIFEFLLFFVLTFVVSAIVSFLWSLIAHGSGAVDWGSSVRLGIILGIALPWAMARGKRKE